MFKHVLTILIISVLLYLAHFFILPNYLQIEDTSNILKQHVFLGGASLFVYISIIITYKVSKLNTGYVFLGLVLAKMIMAGFFVFQMGWLEEGSMIQYRAVFLVFYFIYLLSLLAVCVKLIKRIDEIK